jgi:ATP/ADP translocase
MVFLWPLIIIASIGMEAAFSYSINQVSKETLYVPLDNIAKVKGKAFIDMFVFRGAKAVGAVILLSYTLWLSHHGFTPHFLMSINIIAIALWLFSVFYIGKMIRNSYEAVRISPTIRGRSSEM